MGGAPAPGPLAAAPAARGRGRGGPDVGVGGGGRRERGGLMLAGAAQTLSGVFFACGAPCSGMFPLAFFFILSLALPRPHQAHTRRAPTGSLSHVLSPLLGEQEVQSTHTKHEKRRSRTAASTLTGADESMTATVGGSVLAVLAATAGRRGRRRVRDWVVLMLPGFARQQVGGWARICRGVQPGRRRRAGRPPVLNLDRRVTVGAASNAAFWFDNTTGQ